MTLLDPKGPVLPGAPELQLTLTPAVLGRLMPLFLWLDRRGRIQAMGPTLAKIVGSEALGTSYARHFTLRRARGRDLGPESLADGRHIAVTLVRHPGFNLRGTAVELPGAAQPGALLVNLSFGIHLSEAVRFFGLTEQDFAASELAIEFLFLAEAKTAVLNELQALTRRLEEARREAESEALSDPLTGLPNRRAFDAALDRAVKLLARGGRSFALLHLDLDFFKQVNDNLGHAAGDTVLIRVAQVLAEETRRGDMVARVGGDEFMLILRGPIDERRVAAFAERLIARLEEPIFYDGRPCCVSASIGAVIGADGAGAVADRMLADADSALYRSKRAGRGRCTVCAE
ncbi:GGDEF domain-containing protein [Rhodobacter maris]|uniref:Diguanylate cyclase (GGDEF)-like protein n=1 Tax=Rhodobacter maris TaxID=446682 RepID=A0A285S621_9RHOB|nr:GGDEF domain-containing protein [Rhodobacter maris]SOC02823.1 diguanylate cyclase (GGDEF)-like protein [Rhodobacter maris]